MLRIKDAWNVLFGKAVVCDKEKEQASKPQESPRPQEPPKPLHVRLMIDAYLMKFYTFPVRAMARVDRKL